MSDIMTMLLEMEKKNNKSWETRVNWVTLVTRVTRVTKATRVT